MIVEQFYLNCLAQASHVIDDEQTRCALVIDPRRDGDIYLSFAKEVLRDETAGLPLSRSEAVTG